MEDVDIWAWGEALRAVGTMAKSAYCGHDCLLWPMNGLWAKLVRPELFKRNKFSFLGGLSKF